MWNSELGNPPKPSLSPPMLNQPSKPRPQPSAELSLLVKSSNSQATVETLYAWRNWLLAPSVTTLATPVVAVPTSPETPDLAVPTRAAASSRPKTRYKSAPTDYVPPPTASRLM